MIDDVGKAVERAELNLRPLNRLNSLGLIGTISELISQRPYRTPMSTVHLSASSASCLALHSI